jgi:hypothetical protein
LELDNPAKGTHFCIPMATLNKLILLTVTYTSTTVQMECNVAFPWQKHLSERATMLHYTYYTLSILFNILEFCMTEGEICLWHKMYVSVLSKAFIGNILISAKHLAS